MEQPHYILQLLDERQITLPADKVDIYPAIADQLGDLELGGTIVLNYGDPAALYLVLTTDVTKISTDIETFLKIIRTVDYLRSDDILQTLLTQLKNMFYTSSTLLQLKEQKVLIKQLILSFLSPIQYMFLSIINSFSTDYALVIPTDFKARKQAIFSPDLSYIALYGEFEHEHETRINIYNQGQNVALINIGQENLRRPLSKSSAVTNEGDIYETELSQFPVDAKQIFKRDAQNWATTTEYINTTETNYVIGQLALDAQRLLLTSLIDRLIITANPQSPQLITGYKRADIKSWHYIINNDQRTIDTPLFSPNIHWAIAHIAEDKYDFIRLDGITNRSMVKLENMRKLVIPTTFMPVPNYPQFGYVLFSQSEDTVAIISNIFEKGQTPNFSVIVATKAGIIKDCQNL